jgi:hypothetical protein
MTEVEKIVTRARRARVLFGLAIGVVCIMIVAALAGAIIANVVNVQQDTKITRVERRSACEGNAASEECQQTKREAAKAANLYTTCIAFWKAGYRCPAPGSNAAERTAKGGGATQQPSSTAHQPPSPHAGGSPGGHGTQKHPPASHPTSPPVSPPSQPTPPPAAPEPSLPPQASPNAEPPGLNHAEPPGLLKPALESVCSIADRVAHLC